MGRLRNRLLLAAIGPAICLVVGEVATRAFFGLRGVPLDVLRASYWNPLREGNYYAPHPYLPFVLRPDLRLARVHTDALGRGEGEPRDGVLRVLCLGASGTHGPADREYSWPALLAKAIRERHPDRAFRIINAGVPGYTSADNLVDFALRGVDLAPGVVVVMPGAGDALLSQSPDFLSDHSHGRRSLSAEPNLFDRFPEFFEESSLFLFVRHALYGSTRAGPGGLITASARPYRVDGVSRGMPTLRRNLRSILLLARGIDASVVLVTHPYRPMEPDWTREMSASADVVRELAAAERVPLVDAAAKIRDPRLFSVGDSVHPTPEGYERIAEMVLHVLGEIGCLDR